MSTRQSFTQKNRSYGTVPPEMEFAWLKSFNLKWNSPSMNSSESMPCGGGDLGLNVWVEAGDLFFLVCRSGNFDENGTLMKNGRVRLRMSPNPFEMAEDFRQELRLETGDVWIEAGPKGRQARIHVWVDVFRPVVYVEAEADFSFTAEAAFESWRFEDRKLSMQEKAQCNSYNAYEGDVFARRDEIAWSEDAGGVVFFHRNRTEDLLFNFILRQQNLGTDEGLWNPQKNLTFGGMMYGTGMTFSGVCEGARAGTAFRGWTLATEGPVKSLDLKLILHTAQTETPDAWWDGLRKAVQEAEIHADSSLGSTVDWWRAFWRRGRIVIQPGHPDPSSLCWQVGRNYQLSRYLFGCNARGELAQKFNGGMFTFDPIWLTELHRIGLNECASMSNPFTPDFRCWGGSIYTAQNQRLLCWPMLKSGDVELVVQEFERYRRGLPAAERRAKMHWGHGGASFAEQIEYFGLPAAAFWGFEQGKRQRPADLEDGLMTSPWVRRYFVTQLEFCHLIFEWARFTGSDIAFYLPLIESCLAFYEQHYGDLTPLCIAPAQSIEMYFEAIDPLPDIAALRAVLPALLQRTELDDVRRERWERLLARVPEIPTEIRAGVEVFAPAAQYEEVQRNMEFPELYAVFPHNLAGTGIGQLELARATWQHGISQNMRGFTDCWSQIPIFAARLGLTEESARLICEKMADAPRRFPAFWGPGPDYVPDMDHAGSGMIALQEMLLQTPGGRIILFPAWPMDWDVDFTLHAPQKTTISVSLREGHIVSLHVEPETRMADVETAFPWAAGFGDGDAPLPYKGEVGQ